MPQVYVANCKPHNWDACERESIFGLKLGRNLPALERGDVVLLRLSGSSYGVKAVWYFEQAIRVASGVRVPWSDGPYGWILKCKPITKLPRLFSEDFRTSSKLSTKIPDFPASRIQPSIIRLKAGEAKAYLESIMAEFDGQLQMTFDYLGETKSVEGFLEEVAVSLPREERIMVTKLVVPIATAQAEAEEESNDADAIKITSEVEKTGTPYGVVGERIDLPVLNYAPLNEHGVVLLFGYYLQDLGFSHIEEIRSGFPDAIGMKSIGGGKYKRVRIEFEFKSSSFVKHGHDAKQCDVIVCWTHDWTDSPLEVIELSTVLFQEEK